MGNLVLRPKWQRVLLSPWVFAQHFWVAMGYAEIVDCFIIAYLLTKRYVQ